MGCGSTKDNEAFRPPSCSYYIGILHQHTCNMYVICKLNIEQWTINLAMQTLKVLVNRRLCTDTIVRRNQVMRFTTGSGRTMGRVLKPASWLDPLSLNKLMHIFKMTLKFDFLLKAIGSRRYEINY